MSDALFDLAGVKHAPPPEDLSPDQKRTRRQMELLTCGYHPLSLVLSAPLRLHADAAPADDTKAPGLRCGSCEFREVFSRARDYPKCTFEGVTRINRSPSTDVRRWWPACRDYQPADGAS